MTPIHIEESLAKGGPGVTLSICQSVTLSVPQPPMKNAEAELLAFFCSSPSAVALDLLRTRLLTHFKALNRIAKK